MLDVEFVDSHVHWWDLSSGWYRHIENSGESEGLGSTDGFKRDYLPVHYFKDSEATPPIKLVHVSAAFPKGGPTLETAWLDSLAESSGYPQGIVGTLDLRKGPDGIDEQLDHQARSTRFRGVRMTLGLPFDAEIGDAVLSGLGDRGLLYDVGIHAHTTISMAAQAAARYPSVPFVLEHMGSPAAGSAADFDVWRREIELFASVESSQCKISGIAMTLKAFDAERARPYVEHCLESFGVNRCMIGSNFPVDRLYGSFADLIDMYVNLTSSLSRNDRRDLFAGTAERVYSV